LRLAHFVEVICELRSNFAQVDGAKVFLRLGGHRLWFLGFWCFCISCLGLLGLLGWCWGVGHGSVDILIRWGFGWLALLGRYWCWRYICIRRDVLLYYFLALLLTRRCWYIAVTFARWRNCCALALASHHTTRFTHLLSAPSSSWSCASGRGCSNSGAAFWSIPWVVGKVRDREWWLILSARVGPGSAALAKRSFGWEALPIFVSRFFSPRETHDTLTLQSGIKRVYQFYMVISTLNTMYARLINVSLALRGSGYREALATSFLEFYYL